MTRWSIGAMTLRGGNHGVSKVGGVVVLSGITTGGERSKRRNDRFVFQISIPAKFPPLRPKFCSKPITTLCDVRPKKVRYISPKETTRQWFGGVSKKKGVIGWSMAFLHRPKTLAFTNKPNISNDYGTIDPKYEVPRTHSPFPKNDPK